LSRWLQTCGYQAAYLDIEQAYHSPIAPKHKPYLAVSWNDDIYVSHCAVEGLATVGGIQGCLADALLNFFTISELRMFSNGLMMW